jgi:hypothetical protein
MKSDDYIRSFRSREAVERRLRMLQKPHIAPLTDFVKKLRRKYKTWEFPDFDPLDGGTNADILFLFEKPGPKTSTKGGGSGFISRNNDDPTAEATFGFMQKACISRKRTVLWNFIPGWNDTRGITKAELEMGMEELKELLSLLPKLRTIILVGKKAQRAERFIELRHSNLRIIKSIHSSPIVRARWRDKWDTIPSIWAQANASR